MVFILSKILWVFFAPSNLFTLLLLFGAFAILSHKEHRQRLGRRLVFALALTLFIVAVFPIGQWLITPLENHFPAATPNHVDGIILLAGDENPRLTQARHQPVMDTSAARYLTFASLVQKYPEARLVFIGGTNALHNPINLPTNREIAHDVFSSLGIPDTRLTYEDKSRDTHENAVYGAEIVKPKSTENWLLVTSAYHMPRAMLCFREAGFVVYPAPAAYHTAGNFAANINFDLFAHIAGMNTAIHEYIGLLSYWLMGWIKQPW